MSELHRRVFVRCPPEHAPAHLHRFLKEHADDRGIVRLALRASVHLPALRTEIALQRDVVVTIVDTRNERLQEACTVDWYPADGGPFPRFQGTLAFSEHPEGEGSVLVIDGNYDMPAGFASEAFDVGIGYRIAQATARDLLVRVRDHVEGTYRALQDAKLAR